MAVKTTLQVPAPAERVAVQVEVWPPLMLMPTVPVGVRPAPVTFTVTATDCKGFDGVGFTSVIAVVESVLLTVWLAVPVLGA